MNEGVRKGIYLNIGCGLDAPEGWVNVDASPTLRVSRIPLVGSLCLSLLRPFRWPESVRYGDIVKGLNVRPGGSAAVFVSHVLEHLSLEDFHSAARHIYSYLELNGVLRVIVPDLEKCANDYLEDIRSGRMGSAASEKFMKNINMGCTASRRKLSQRLLEIFSRSRHQWMWDFPSLKETLIRHGFREIRRCSYGDWSDPMFERVERRERHENSVCIEALK